MASKKSIFNKDGLRAKKIYGSNLTEFEYLEILRTGTRKSIKSNDDHELAQYAKKITNEGKKLFSESAQEVRIFLKCEISGRRIHIHHLTHFTDVLIFLSFQAEMQKSKAGLNFQMNFYSDEQKSA